MHALLLLLIASDADFNGRWNLTVANEPRQRAWWLEIEGAGGPGPLRGRFIGFPGGDLNSIDDLALASGELTFSTSRGGRRLAYRARLKGGDLAGTRSDGSAALDWIGRRAPVIKDKDDGSWKPGHSVALFNGRDLSGWRGVVSGKELGWSVKDGVLTNVAGANNLVSEKKFWNFELHAEYRLSKQSNSGIGLRARYEVQVLDDHGRPPDTHSHGALYSRIPPAVNASKPPGEWQSLDVRLAGRDVTIVLNGHKVIDRQVIEGLTAMATDADEGAPGPITLQGDHREVEFRSMVVTPLEKR